MHLGQVVAHSLCPQTSPRRRQAAERPGAPDGEESANKWVVLVLSGTGAFMTTLDSSIVNIGLPAIAREFGVPLTGSVEWIINGYLVAIAATLLTFGRLADELGRKPLFIGGLVVFVIGSALCGAAPSVGWLIAARGLEAIGAAAIFSVNLAMITSVFPSSEHGKALGINAILVALGVSAGPTLGGILVQTLSWRWIFYVNVPIGLIAVVVAWRVLTERVRRTRQHFDFTGAILFAVGLVGVNLYLSFGQERGWTSASLLAVAVVAILALAVATLVERRAQAPLLDLNLLRNRVFISSNIGFLLAMMALFSVAFLLPFYLEELRGYDTLRAGFLLTPLPLTLAVVAPVFGALSDRFGSRWFAPAGVAIACGGILLLSRLTPDSTHAYLIACLVVTGFGQGMFTAPNTHTILRAAPRTERGEASGILATARVTGQSLGVGIAGTMFIGAGAAAAGSKLLRNAGSLQAPEQLVLEQTFIAGLSSAFRVCAAVAAIGVVTALIRGKAAGRPVRDED